MTYEPVPLPRQIRNLLADLRSRIRGYVWLEGLAATVTCLGVAFWASLGLDYWLEPIIPIRALLLAAVLVALLFVVFRLIIRRAFVRLSDRSMALLIERRYKDFGDSLLTAVELSARDAQHADFDRTMLERVCKEVQGQARGITLGKIFNPYPLMRVALAALMLLVSISVFASRQPEALALWARRTLQFSDELWPRDTHLVIEGFANGRTKVARGADLQLIVKADTQKVVPERVEVRYRKDEGGSGNENMVREGDAVPGRDEYQNYSHKFQGILTPITFDIRGGDDRIRDLRIDVVDSPTITKTTLYCEYPRYMVREEQDLYTPREIPTSEFMQLPIGTRVTVRAKTNKPLLTVQVDYLDAEQKPVRKLLDFVRQQPLPDSFEFTIDSLDADQTLLFTLLDHDEISNKDPIRLSLGARPDEPPQVAIRFRGIGTAITPAARIPIVGEISDDYGVAAAWFEYAIDEEEPVRRPLDKQPKQATTVTFPDQLEDGEAFDVRDELQLTPGQKLQLTVKADDTFALSEAPHTGFSQKFVLDVVTPDQLRLILESRELNLRRRFETILDELNQTRDALAGISFEKPASDPTQPPTDSATADPDARSGSTAALYVQRGQQNCQKNSHETLGVANGFDEIREELINNRLDTTELKARLKERIADPLRKIVEVRFPELDRRLDLLLARVSDSQAGPAALAEANQQLDLVLVEMQAVLSEMLELETFNEAVALLRSIIESQQKLNEQTKQKRKTLLD